MDGAFECDRDTRGGVGAMGADAGRVKGGSSGQPEGGGKLKREPAFEFGRAENGILGAAFESDELGAGEMPALSNEVKIRPRAPGAQAPSESAFIFEGRAQYTVLGST